MDTRRHLKWQALHYSLLEAIRVALCGWLHDLTRVLLLPQERLTYHSPEGSRNGTNWRATVRGGRGSLTLRQDSIRVLRLRCHDRMTGSPTKSAKSGIRQPPNSSKASPGSSLRSKVSDQLPPYGHRGPRQREPRLIGAVRFANRRNDSRRLNGSLDEAARR